MRDFILICCVTLRTLAFHKGPPSCSVQNGSEETIWVDSGHGCHVHGGFAVLHFI